MIPSSAEEFATGSVGSKMVSKSLGRYRVSLKEGSSGSFRGFAEVFLQTPQRGHINTLAEEISMEGFWGYLGSR